MAKNDGVNCLGCSLVLCVLIIAAVYLITHLRISFV